MAQRKTKSHWSKALASDDDNRLYYRIYNLGPIVAYYIKERAVFESDITFDGEFKHLENNFGVYFLFKDNNIYIGQASQRKNTKYGMQRLREHHDSTTESYRNDWESAIFITRNDNKFSTAMLDTLEHTFIKIFKNDTRYNCKNTSDGMDGNLQEDNLEYCIQAIIELLALCKIDINEEAIDTIAEEAIDANKKLYNDLAKACEDIKREVRQNYTDEIQAKLDWITRVEEYDNIRDKVASASNYIMRGRIFKGLANKEIAEVLTPEGVAQQMVDSLPDKLFNSKTIFLDPASKSGIYLVLLLNKLMSDDTNLPINHEKEFVDKRERLKHIINKQLFGLSVSIEGYMLSINNLTEAIENHVSNIYDGRVSIRNQNTDIPNIKYYDNYLSDIKSKRTDLKDKITTIFSGDKDMKFDVVIGNPPYQEQTEGGGTGTRGLPIYASFILAGQELSNIVSMITPTRWYSQPETEFKELRKKMLNGSLLKLRDYDNAAECFPNVSIAGGVSYWLWVKNRIGLTEMSNTNEEWTADLTKIPVLLRYKYAQSVAEKVKAVEEKMAVEVKTFDSIVAGTDMFGVNRKKLGVEQKDNEHTCLLKHSSNFARKHGVSEIEYINPSVIKKNSKYIGSYKLITEYMNGSSDTVFNNLEIQNPNEICDLSFVVISAVNNKELIENIKSYFETKLIRFLIKSTITNTTITRNNYCLVPMQDFTHPWTDQQLYEKYQLSTDEIEYIESTIKSMDTSTAAPKQKFTAEDIKANYVQSLINKQ